jgi:hypothetical protein
MVGTTTMKAQITIKAVGTWLEPYIGMVFQVINKGERKTTLHWYGGVTRNINNRYLRFLEGK